MCAACVKKDSVFLMDIYGAENQNSTPNRGAQSLDAFNCIFDDGGRNVLLFGRNFLKTFSGYTQEETKGHFQVS